eukprot:6132973-Prymnesium_polylepis.1
MGVPLRFVNDPLGKSKKGWPRVHVQSQATKHGVTVGALRSLSQGRCALLPAHVPPEIAAGGFEAGQVPCEGADRVGRDPVVQNASIAVGHAAVAAAAGVELCRGLQQARRDEHAGRADGRGGRCCQRSQASVQRAAAQARTDQPMEWQRGGEPQLLPSPAGPPRVQRALGAAHHAVAGLQPSSARLRSTMRAG